MLPIIATTNTQISSKTLSVQSLYLLQSYRIIEPGKRLNYKQERSVFHLGDSWRWLIVWTLLRATIVNEDEFETHFYFLFLWTNLNYLAYFFSLLIYSLFLLDNHNEPFRLVLTVPYIIKSCLNVSKYVPTYLIKILECEFTNSDKYICIML